MAVLYYEMGAIDTHDNATISGVLKVMGGKIEVGAAGVVVRFRGGKYISVEHTGYYDAAGTATATAQPVFYMYGLVAPNLTFAGDTTQADLDSLPLIAGKDVLVAPTGTEWSVFFKPASGAVTLAFRPNDTME